RCWSTSCQHTSDQGGTNGECAGLLERRGILSSADAPGAVDGADSAAGIAVAATMSHALGPGVRIEAIVGNWGNGNAGGNSVRLGGLASVGIGVVVVVVGGVGAQLGA